MIHLKSIRGAICGRDSLDFSYIIYLLFTMQFVWIVKYIFLILKPLARRVMIMHL